MEELKKRHVSVNDFDFETIIALEDEYNNLSGDWPECTKRKNEILLMRRDLIRNLKHKQPQNIDVYIDLDRTRCIVYWNGQMFSIDYIDYKAAKLTFDNIVDVIDSKLNGFDNKNIYIDTHGLGMGIAGVFDSRGINYKSIKLVRYKTTGRQD